MVPAFGFSVGDFISAIDLTVKISKALREATGAPAEYRLLIQDLHNLQQILELLQALRPAGGSISHTNAIRGVAITCIIPLRDFAEKLDRNYGLLANSSAASDRLLQRGGKKAQWAVFATKEVAKFRSNIAAKVASIGLLLNIFTTESLARIELQNQESQNYLIANSAEHRESLERRLSQLAVSHQQKISNDVHQASKEVTATIVRTDDQMQLRHAALLSQVDQQGNQIEGLNRFVVRLQRNASANMKDVIGLCIRSTANTKRDFEAVQCTSKKIEEEVKSMGEQQSRMGSRMLENLHTVFHQIRLMRMAWTGVLGCLVPFSEKVLRYLQENVKANMEIYALLLNLQSTMPKRLDNGDKIYFEDVLGRTNTLPYEYFRH